MILKTRLITGVLALLGGAGIISVATSQSQPRTQLQNQTQSQEHKSKITEKTIKNTSKPEKAKTPIIATKQISETESIPFNTESYNDSSLPKNQTRVDVPGQNGILTKIYEITYSDGVETNRKLISSKRTTEPVTKVIAIGTYVAPPPATSGSSNGTYVNSAGNTVESPNSNASGATAICRDGTYSHSQSRRGTCSHHGGVAQWL